MLSALGSLDTGLLEMSTKIKLRWDQERSRVQEFANHSHVCMSFVDVADWKSERSLPDWAADQVRQVDSQKHRRKPCNIDNLTYLPLTVHRFVVIVLLWGNKLIFCRREKQAAWKDIIIQRRVGLSWSLNYEIDDEAQAKPAYLSSQL